MSKLEKLIQELCPNGVEYRKIKEICSITRGRVISKKDIQQNQGKYPVYSSQTELQGILGYISTYDFDGEYITWTTDGANAGTIFYRNGKFTITNVCGLLKVINQNVLPKFLSYYLSITTIKFVNRGMGNPKLMNHTLEKISIPLPPLEVQKEIVRILDSYTKFTEELKENLAKELTLRKKQYEYYHNNLCDFKNRSEITWQSLGDLFEFKNGLNKGKDYFGKGSPIINFTDVFRNTWLIKEKIHGLVTVTDKEKLLYSAKKNDVFFTRTSETKEEIGKTSVLLDEITNCVFSGFVLRARPKTNKLLPKFCSYYFSTNEIRKYIIANSSFTTRALTSGKKLSKIKIPLPSLEEQERIVKILDKFDALCNDLSIGLPAEIEKRQKQYEYYREKLLTFKEKQ